MDINLNDEKITRKLYERNKIVIKINIPLQRELFNGKTKHFHSVYTNNEMKRYFTVDIDPFITMEMKDGTAWSKNKNIMITNQSLPSLTRAFKRMIRNIETGDIFAQLPNGELVVKEGRSKQYTIIVDNLPGNQYLQMVPSIYYDENEDLTYECCLVYFNRESFMVPVVIDDFYAIYDILKKIDIYMYSQVLLNYYVSIKDKIEKPEETNSKSREKTTSVFDVADKPETDNSPMAEIKSSKIANVVSSMSDSEFFGIK